MALTMAQAVAQDPEFGRDPWQRLRENLMADLTWILSKSSNLHSYAYDRDAKRLHVKFRSGASGHYDDVPPEIFQEMHQAPSHGKFLHARLKGNDKHPWNPTPKEHDHG